MSFTAEQVVEAFEGEDYSESVEEKYGYGNVWDGIYYEQGTGTVIDVPGLGQVEKVESGGGEGDGAETYLILRVLDTDQLFQKTGHYSSWDSNYWEGPLTEVEAYVQPKTYYRRKKQA